MKSKFLLMMFMLVFVVSPMSLMAQDEGDEDDLDDLDLSVSATETDTESKYFSLGAGFIGQFHFTNLDGIATDLEAAGFTGTGDFNTPIFMMGAHGFTAIGIVPNLRIGFFGMAGSNEITQNVTINDAAATIGYEYEISMTGLSFDYAIVPMRQLAILPGANLGYGAMTMESWRTPNDGVDWDNFLGSADEDYYFNRATASIFFLEPNLKIEYAVAPFVMLRLQGSYIVNISKGDWEFNRTGKFNDGTSSFGDAKADGFSFQFGINVGLFNY